MRVCLLCALPNRWIILYQICYEGYPLLEDGSRGFKFWLLPIYVGCSFLSLYDFSNIFFPVNSCFWWQWFLICIKLCFQNFKFSLFPRFWILNFFVFQFSFVFTLHGKIRRLNTRNFFFHFNICYEVLQNWSVHLSPGYFVVYDCKWTAIRNS